MNKDRALIAAVLVLVLAIGANTYIGLHDSRRISRDEQAIKAKATHTAKVQRAGEPVAVCLLDAMKAVTPLLLRVPSVAQPLEAYVTLQSKRYPGVRCPEKHTSP